jgi:prepilin peptidase CpaA
LDLLRVGVLVFLLTVAIYTDLVHRKVYNWATLPALGLGLGMAAGHTFLVEDMFPMWISLTSLGLALLVFGLPTWLGWLGAGDLKLMCAIGALQGPPLGVKFMLDAIYHTALMGAVMAGLILIWKGRFLSGCGGSLRLIIHPKVQRERDPQDEMPYAVAISLGCGFSLFQHLL